MYALARFLLVSLLLICAAAAQPRVDVRQTFVRDPKDPARDLPVLNIRLVDDAGKVLTHLIRSDSPAASDAGRFRVLEGGSAKKRLGLAIYKRATQAAFPGLQSEIILISGNDTLDPAKSYSVEMPEVADSPGIALKGFAPIARFGPITVNDAPVNVQFLNRNKALQKKFALLGGKDGTSASLRVAYGTDSLERASSDTDRFWRLQSILEADLSYRPKQNRDYLNNVVGEVDLVFAQFLRSHPTGATGPTPPGSAAITDPGLSALYETGFATRLEGDQTFDKMNWTIGWTNWLSVNSPGLSRLATALCLFGKAEAATPPVLSLSYDYVAATQDDLDEDLRGKDTGRNRLRGRFYWSLQLANDMNLIVVKNYDAYLLIDVGAVHDFEHGTTYPDVRLSLDIGPDSPIGTAPSFTISFVNGKTTPTFRDFQAILAGFKLAF